MTTAFNYLVFIKVLNVIINSYFKSQVPLETMVAIHLIFLTCIFLSFYFLIHYTNFIYSQQKAELPQSDPITHPLYGTTPSQTLPSNGYGDPSAQQFNQFSMYPQNPPQMFQPPTNNVSRTFDQSGYNQASYNPNALTNTTKQQIHDGGSGTVRAETPQPIQKGPIPEEHMHMKTVLDELRNRCSCTSNHAVSIGFINQRILCLSFEM